MTTTMNQKSHFSMSSQSNDKLGLLVHQDQEEDHRRLLIEESDNEDNNEINNQLNNSTSSKSMTISIKGHGGGKNGEIGIAAAAAARQKYLMRILSALFYASASFLITVANKIVLTTYKFPSYHFVALGQIFTAILVLSLARQLRIISFPPFSRDSFRKIFPLPLIFIGNAVTGLGGTKELSLPMFTALRRFSILMTMIGEFYLLGVRPSTPVQFSVYTMIVGSIIASSNDLSFSVEGYTLVMLNNFFTASNGVYIKKKLDSKEFGKYGLMYYNALYMFFPLLIFAALTGEIDKAYNYCDWDNAGFLICFFLSCVMGFVLNASVVLCTQHNSALTTTIIGCLKNISVTYLGMFIGGDYVFHWLNFLGINVSVFGSLIYTYVTFSGAGGS